MGAFVGVHLSIGAIVGVPFQIIGIQTTALFAFVYVYNLAYFFTYINDPKHKGGLQGSFDKFFNTSVSRKHLADLRVNAGGSRVTRGPYIIVTSYCFIINEYGHRL